MSLRKWLADRISPPEKEVQRDYIFNLISLSSDAKAMAILDERQTEIIGKEKLEKLYKVDPLIFSMIEEYKSGIVTDFVIEGGTTEDRIRVLKWFRDTGYIFKLQDAIVDIFLTGNSWQELIPNFEEKTMTIKYINPKTIDFMRDPVTGNVILDGEGSFEGYEQTVGMDKVEWTKESVKSRKKGTIIRNDLEDLRTRIAQFKLFSFSESGLGLTPLATVYKSCIIRLNMADMIGESAYRSGGLILKVPRDISEQSRTNLEKDATNLTRRNVMILEDRIEPGLFPTPPLTTSNELIQYFAQEVAAGMRVPLCLLMAGTTSYQTNLRDMTSKWELSLRSHQDKLAYQIREKVLKKLWEVWGLDSEVCSIRFLERTPTAQLNRSRVIATLARRELITRDPELELRLRSELQLPSMFVEKQLDEWINTGKISSEETKERDIIQKPEEPTKEKDKPNIPVEEVPKDDLEKSIKKKTRK